MKLKWLKVTGGTVAAMSVIVVVTVLILHESDSTQVGEPLITILDASESIKADAETTPIAVTNSDETMAHNDKSALIVAVVSLAILAFSSLALSFWLYRWRRTVIGGKEIVVPEDWRNNSRAVSQSINLLIQATENLNNRFFKAETSFHEDANDLRSKISELTEMFMTLQDNLNEKDAEIKRLKKGYDTEIFRKFLNRFVRVDQAISDYLQSNKIDLDGLQQISLVLEDALDECGAKSFSPKIGDDYTTTEGVADNPKIIRTDDSGLVGKIKEVFEPGYKLNTGEIITLAKVSVYGQFLEEKI